MSRRNFILLIIVLIILLVTGLYFFSSSSTQTGEPKNENSFLSSLNPFGKSNLKIGQNNNTDIDKIEDNTPTATTEEIRKFNKISSMPIAGYTVFQKEKVTKEFHPNIRYVSRENGNIYQTYGDDIKEEKFSNTIIPRVYEAFFGNTGKTVLMRYLKGDGSTIQTYLGNMPTEKVGVTTTSTVDIVGSFLPENISDLSISPDTSKVFYIVNNEDNATGIVLNLKDNKKTQVLSSPFTEWLTAWGGEKIQFLNTKASGVALGYLYKIENTKIPQKVLGDIYGLSTLPSKDAKNILLNNNSLALSVYNINTKNTNPISLNTHIDKCVWSKDNINIYCAVPKNVFSATYPDAWYQGEVSFDDQIWKINIGNQNTELVFDPSSLNGGVEIDAIKLSLSQDENYLLFVNKKDSYLWQYQLK